MIQSKWLAALGIALGVTLSSGSVWAEEDSANAEDGASEKTCFWLRNINDFRAIDNRHVWVRGPTRKNQYLLTLFQNCTGVRFTEHIALDTRPTNRLCSNGNEHLTVLDGSFSQRCLISNVERVETIKQARELVQARKDAKEQKDEGASLDTSEDTKVALDESNQ